MGGQINKKTSLFMLTWPIFIEMLLQMLVSNVDQLMISRISENAVAAIGNVNQIMSVLLITFSVVTMATTILVAQYLGSNNQRRASEVYTVAVFSNLIFSIIIGLILFLFNDAIFTLVKLPHELLADAKMYISIIGGGIFLQGIFMTYAAIFRSNGLMKQGMYISAIVNVLNIIGNLILLNGYFGLPKMGIAGVAISSVISRLIGVIIIIYIFKKKIKGEVSLKYLFPFPMDIFKRLMRIGVPSGGEAISYNASQMVILAFVNTMGITAIAARSYISILAWISYVYASAVSQANQVRVAYLAGSNDYDEAEAKIIETLKLANIVTIIISVLVFLFSDQLLGIFTSNAEILKLGKTILFIDIILEIGRTYNMVIIRAIQAAGDIKYPIIVGISSMWAIATLFSYIFGITFKLGLYGVWIAMMADECIRAVIFYFRLKSGKWRLKKII